MSRTSDAKKARRRKRKAASQATWIPAPVFDEIAAAESELDDVGGAVAAVDEWITGRDWDLDTDGAAGQLVSWVYPPSAAEFDDDDWEPVTRIWLRLDDSDDEVVLEFGCVLVGFGAGDHPYLLDPDTLFDDIDVVEAYRDGLPKPVLH